MHAPQLTVMENWSCHFALKFVRIMRINSLSIPYFHATIPAHTVVHILVHVQLSSFLSTTQLVTYKFWEILLIFIISHYCTHIEKLLLQPVGVYMAYTICGSDRIKVGGVVIKISRILFIQRKLRQVGHKSLAGIVTILLYIFLHFPYIVPRNCSCKKLLNICNLNVTTWNFY